MRALLILALSVAWIASCGSPPAPTSEVVGGVRNVNAAALKGDLDAGKVKLLVDVRTPEEYAGGHVPGAKNIPLDQLPARYHELAPYKEGEIYVICQSGRRSLAASQTLASAGYSPVNVEGGTAGWRSAGFPTE